MNSKVFSCNLVFNIVAPLSSSLLLLLSGSDWLKIKWEGKSSLCLWWIWRTFTLCCGKQPSLTRSHRQAGRQTGEETHNRTHTKKKKKFSWSEPGSSSPPSVEAEPFGRRWRWKPDRLRRSRKHVWNAKRLPAGEEEEEAAPRNHPIKTDLSRLSRYRPGALTETWLKLNIS